ncbi:MAG: hypothetical protein HY814_02580 [Candidatus Riflebacteria bacterium]|nr:hypothetical protein [Candidatus Riflebacteria bacterium]
MPDLLVIEDKEVCPRCGDVVTDGSNNCFKCSLEAAKSGMTSTVFTLLDFSLAFMLKVVGLTVVAYPLMLLALYSSYSTLQHLSSFRRVTGGSGSDTREDVGLVRIMTYLAPVFFTFSILTGYPGTFFVSLVMSSISLAFFYNLQKGQHDRHLALPRSQVEMLQQDILRTIAGSERSAKGLLTSSLTPKIENLNQTLTNLKSKKNQLDSVYQGYNVKEIKTEIERLKREMATEPDERIKRALTKSLQISEAMLENYSKMERMRRLYDVQMDIIVKNYKNLRMKIATLNLSDDVGRGVEKDIEKLETEVKVIEDSFLDVSEILQSLPER